MPVTDLCPANAHRLLPLLHQVHESHLRHQPRRYAPLPEDARMIAHLRGWLSEPGVVALGYDEGESLRGYAIYKVEKLAATPFRRGETRVMLHHICVDAAYRRRGIGMALMDEIRARLRREGAQVLATTYAEFNTASAELMARAGLRPVVSFAEWRAEDDPQ